MNWILSPDAGEKERKESERSRLNAIDSTERLFSAAAPIRARLESRNRVRESVKGLKI